MRCRHQPPTGSRRLLRFAGAAGTCPRQPLDPYAYDSICLVRFLNSRGRLGPSGGAGGGIRTPDRLITNQLLYRLSYASQTKRKS
jgi:hypothetical protein